MGRSETADVQLGGALVQEEHAVINYTEAGIAFRTIGDSIAFINGAGSATALPFRRVAAGQQCAPGVDMALSHADRIVIASSHYFRINIPRNRDGRKMLVRARIACVEYAAQERQQH